MKDIAGRHLVLLLWAVVAFVPVGFAEEATPPTATGDVERPAPDGGDGETADAPVTKSPNSLGNFIEVVVTTRDLSTFEGWIRDKARVEIHDASLRRYVQLPDVPSSRGRDGAGLRLFYVDGIEGFIFIKYEDIEEEGIELVRKISREEEEEWEEDLKRQLLKARESLQKQLEAQKRAEAEAAAEEVIEGELAAAETAGEIPPGLERGYRLLEEFPPPTWGHTQYQVLRKHQITRDRKLTLDEQRFVESYATDWKPAYEHQSGDVLPKVK